MGESRLSNGWLYQAAYQEVPSLFQKSLDLTLALIDVSKAVRQAADASDNLFQQCFAPRQVINTVPNTITKEAGTLFVSVTTSLAKDGTFWCKYWSSQDSLHCDKLKEISDKLSVSNKEEISINAATDAQLNKPMFVYSTTHNLYVRVAVVKYTLPSEQVSVRYLDYGVVGEIPLNTNFYMIPKGNEEQQPFLSMYCALSDDETLALPYEAKWRFRDLTCNQVLMARVVKKVNRNSLCCSVLEMKSLLGEEFNINEQVMEKVQDHQQEVTETTASKKKKNDDVIFAKPHPLVATIEPVKQPECKQKERNRSRSSDPSVCRNKRNKESRSQTNSRPTSPEFVMGQKGKASRSSSLTTISRVGKCEVMSRSTDSLVVSKSMQKKLSYKDVDLSSASGKKKVSIDKKENITAVEELLAACLSSEDVTCRETAGNENSERSDSDSIVSPPAVNDTSNGFQTSSEIINSPDEPHITVGEKSPVNGDVNETSENSNDKVKQVNGIDGKENIDSGAKKESKSRSDPYWVDSIPIADRRNVVKLLPPVANLFYTATKLWDRCWQDIELLNVQRLLQSRAVIQFFLHDTYLHRFYDSFKDGILHVSGDTSILFSQQKTSRYLIFRDHYKKTFLGMAKIEGSTSNFNNPQEWPVTYLCLSATFLTPRKWRKNIHKPLTLIELRDAKSMVQYLRDSIKSGRTKPLFPDVYPWSGVPPLLDEIVKPDKTKKKEIPSLFSFELFQSNNSPKESWDDEEQEEDTTPSGYAAKGVTPDLITTTTALLGDPVPSSDVTDGTTISSCASEKALPIGPQEEVQKEIPPEDGATRMNFQPKRILQRYDGVEAEEKGLAGIEALHVKSENAEGSESCENLPQKISPVPREITLRKHICGGYYDETGMWYPSVDAAKIIPVRKLSEHNIDQNENLVSPDILHQNDEPTEEQNKTVAPNTMLQNHVTVIDEDEDFEKSDMENIEKSIERLIESPTFASYSDDNEHEVEENQRLERNCDVFGVAKEDLEDVH
ncbi:uncharacterized protein LOC130645511 isoform X2 [Hydractinia symbiolongicarpus]|uniref:uncharacterized protein LOC130645511 isoform X2 n=1 Tax=Hydractinia symbiolongicarpus TaxID=13093 RepID=UPI00254FF2E5|nr:uncharacterized protein LOC130645511 isoform X2 [Hydractinia symbiolongicarpus]